MKLVESRARMYSAEAAFDSSASLTLELVVNCARSSLSASRAVIVNSFAWLAERPMAFSFNLVFRTFVNGHYSKKL
jgi:hypothetical protein